MNAFMSSTQTASQAECITVSKQSVSTRAALDHSCARQPGYKQATTKWQSRMIVMVVQQQCKSETGSCGNYDDAVTLKHLT
jgi:hypothetical protein